MDDGLNIRKRAADDLEQFIHYRWEWKNVTATRKMVCEFHIKTKDLVTKERTPKITV